MTQTEYLEMFEGLTKKMIAITTAKNNDYAGVEDPFKNFRDFGTLGFLVRLSDKWSRIRNLLGSGKSPAVVDEKVEDTLLDMSIYCLLLLCWLRAENVAKIEVAAPLPTESAPRYLSSRSR